MAQSSTAPKRGKIRAALGAVLAMALVMALDGPAMGAWLHAHGVHAVPATLAAILVAWGVPAAVGVAFGLPLIRRLTAR